MWHGKVLHVEQFNCLYFQTLHCNYLINNWTVCLREFFDRVMTDRLLGIHWECRDISFEMHNRGEPLLAVFNTMFGASERASNVFRALQCLTWLVDKRLFKLLPSLVTAHFSFIVCEETVYNEEIAKMHSSCHNLTFHLYNCKLSRRRMLQNQLSLYVQIMPLHCLSWHLVTPRMFYVIGFVCSDLYSTVGFTFISFFHLNFLSRDKGSHCSQV